LRFQTLRSNLRKINWNIGPDISGLMAMCKA